MFHLATLTLGLIVVLRFVPQLPIPRTLKYGLGTALLVVSQHHLLTRLVWGNMFSPEVPRAAMIAVNWLFGAILLLAGIQLVVEIVRALASLARRRWLTVPTSLATLFGAAAMLVSGYGVAQAIRLPRVRTVEVRIAGLDPALDGLRVLHLTDIHSSRLFDRPFVEAVVAQANAERPHLILITGDLIDGTVEARRHDIAPLAELRAPLGVYVTPGNHEYYFGYQAWMDQFRRLGLRVLENGHAVIRDRSAALTIAGVTDRAAGDRGLPMPDIERAIAGAPDGVPIILMYHQPGRAAEASKARVALQLSGHTHGGMIRGFDRLIAKYNSGFVSGLYNVAGMPLHVGNGTAMWIGFAIRLGVRSEMTVFRLKHEAQKQIPSPTGHHRLRANNPSNGS